MKCANCDGEALWVYEGPASDPAPFCDAHLPGFLRAQAKAGLLTKTDYYHQTHDTVAAMLAPDPVPVPQPMTAEAPAPEFVPAGEYEGQEDVPAPKRARKKVAVEEPVEG